MLRQYLIILFGNNEVKAISFVKHGHWRPLTDEQLECKVRQQFANDPTVIASLDSLPENSSTSRIRIWRSEYNRGLWPVKPAYRSFRYGPDGVPINRHGNPLGGAEIESLLLSFPFDDPRKVSYASACKEGYSAD